MAESECPAMELTCWGKPHNEDLSRFLELGREGLRKEQLCSGAVPVEEENHPSWVPAQGRGSSVWIMGKRGAGSLTERAKNSE